MKLSERIDEPTGRMVKDHGDCEYQYDPPLAGNSDAPGHNLESYQAVERRRRKHGWTAEWQRISPNALTNTGSVCACREGRQHHAALRLPPEQPSRGRTLYRRVGPCRNVMRNSAPRPSLATSSKKHSQPCAIV